MRTFAALCALSLLVAPAARAAVSGPDAPAPADPAPLSCFSLGAHMSYWNIPDLDSFDIDGAIGGGVVGQFHLNRFLGFELRLSGYATGYSEDVYIENEGWFDTDFTIVSMPMEVGLVGFLPLNNMFSVYGGPGAGYYLFDGQFSSKQGPRETTYDIEINDEGGFYLLGGVRAQLVRNLALYVEGKYTWVETSVEQNDGLLEDLGIHGLNKDLDFSGLAINAGMLFTF